MAAKNGKGSVQHFLKEQLGEAQKRLNTIETEAEKALKGLIAKGKSRFEDQISTAAGVASQALRETSKGLTRLSKKVDGYVKKSQPDVQA